MYQLNTIVVSIRMFMAIAFLISPSMAHAAPLLYLAAATGGALLALASLFTGPWHSPRSLQPS